MMQAQRVQPEIAAAPYRDAIVEFALRNWSNWLRGRTGGVACCGSAERWYRSPQHWWPEPARINVDEIAALRVERAMRGVPAGHRRALFLHYVARADDRYAVRKLGIRYEDWERYLDDARRMLANRLLRQ